MRILIKGGVWKNTEDEILKAAVMKYGKNQWARVSSLLNRKSAKQCKARWYEWLDPSIKKTEWSKEEEEKLLHLAKLMPNQWRTIAPIVGRTAGQCMEHYEALLDQAQESTEGISEDPRKLRPGEIDPTPELRPARPDPIDMDDDEKEMLSEARARLANTMGKKAKRKARERMLDESRRISMLQKRRELKAAGLETHLGGGNKRKYIDYGKEIPFQQVPPAGFYDVEEENIQGRSVKLDPKKHGIDIDKMEGRHHDEEEKRNQQRDKRRLNKLFREDAPAALAKLSEANDPTILRKRSSLALPAPQVSDAELEDIVKVGQNLLMAPPVGGLRLGGAATHSLLGDYSSSLNRPTPTPMRTPVQEDMIKQEARNQRLLRDVAGPFALSEAASLRGDDDLEDVEGEDGEGGRRPGRKSLHPELSQGTGYEGINPRKSSLATPNMLVASLGGVQTPGRSVAGSVKGGRPGSSTPGGSVFSGRSKGLSSAGSGTPLVLRDELGLNKSRGDDAEFELEEEEAERRRLRRGLQGKYKLDSGEVEGDSEADEDEEDDDRSFASSRMAGGRGRRIGSSNASVTSTLSVKDRLAQRLKSLPEPEFTYDFNLPSQEDKSKGKEKKKQSGKMKVVTASGVTVEDVSEGEEDSEDEEEELEEEEDGRDWEVGVGGSGSSRIVRDSADVDQQRAVIAQMKKDAFWRRQSTVIQKGGRDGANGFLPRPTIVPPLLTTPSASNNSSSQQQKISQSLRQLFSTLSVPSPSLSAESGLMKIEQHKLHRLSQLSPSTGDSQTQSEEHKVEELHLSPEEDPELLSQASALINYEMARMIYKDELYYPANSTGSVVLLPDNIRQLIDRSIPPLSLTLKAHGSNYQMTEEDEDGEGEGEGGLVRDIEYFDETKRESDSKGKKRRKVMVNRLRERDESIKQAREMIREEYQKHTHNQHGSDEASLDIDSVGPERVSRLSKALEDTHKTRSFLPEKGVQGQYGVPENKKELLGSLQAQFETLKGKYEKDGKKMMKLESKLNKITAGYSVRAQGLEKRLVDSWQEYNTALDNLESFSKLSQLESQAIDRRLKEAQEELRKAKEVEDSMQKKYDTLQFKIKQVLK